MLLYLELSQLYYLKAGCNFRHFELYLFGHWIYLCYFINLIRFSVIDILIDTLKR